VTVNDDNTAGGLMTRIPWSPWLPLFVGGLVVSLQSQTDTAVRVVLISIDGLVPSAYTQPGPARIPAIRRLVSEGAWAEGVIGVLPSSTYPAHTTMITGVAPAVHGIVDNHILDPLGLANDAWYWYARDIKVPTLAAAARAKKLRVGAFSWPVTVGMELDYLVPEFWRSRHPETLTLLRALSWPRTLIDTIETGAKLPLTWPITDTMRADAFAFMIARYRPHLSLLHLIDLDQAQHRAGPGSPESLAVLEQMDGHVARILDAIARAGLRERTYVAVVSDHGFLPVSQSLQPNALLKQEGLIKTDAGGGVVDWQAWFHESGGSGYVHLKNRTDAAVHGRVGELLRKLAADPQNGIETVWSADELRAAGADPRAVFGIGMRPGFNTARGHDRLLRPSADKGAHGFAPSRPEMHASLVLVGPGLKGRGGLGLVRMTQIAPTLARLLGVSLTAATDVPLDVRAGGTAGSPGRPGTPQPAAGRR
jgi:predicted AlkP superfamily pyrophosphatase or phosphodiesterase